MTSHLPLWIVLLALLSAGNLLAPRLRIPAPVLLALLGIGLGALPNLPRFALDPDLILVTFLPPLLYADAFNTSWTDFRRWLRPILSLAVGLVAFTTLAVGVVAHALLDGVPWAVCFILGAIVSPTDTVAVQSIIERLRVPRRVTAILGGESLVNDATGLVGVQLGVAVALSGAFEAGAAALAFARVTGIGLAIGALVGAVFALLNRAVRETRVLFVLSLLSPYLAYAVAQALDASGVLAVVVAGFVVAWRIHAVPGAARVELYATWDLVTYVLNGLCFLFVGLETPPLLRAATAECSVGLLAAGLTIAAVVIAARIAWCFPAAYVPLLLSPRRRELEGGLPRWQNVALASWCGVRGVVSLAAALALPRQLADGSPFPGRDAAIACTLCVILATLIAQGLTLLPLIRLLGIREEAGASGEVRAAREVILAAGIARLDAFCTEVSCPVSVHHFRTVMQDHLKSLEEADAEERTRARVRLEVSNEVHRAVAEAQRAALLGLRDTGRVNDRVYMELLLGLDREHLGASDR